MSTTNDEPRDGSRPRGLRLRGLLALLAILALLAGACSSDSDDGADDDGSTETTAEAGTEGDDVDPDGVIRVGYDLVASNRGGFTWDPTQAATGNADAGPLYWVYGGFFRQTNDGEFVPDLAESAEVVGVDTIEIALRPDLTFSDGTPLDAAAVEAGLERSLAQGDPAAFGDAFASLQSVEVVDPTTVRLVIPDGTAPAWYSTYMASWETTIVPPNFDPADPIGAGPFTIASYQPEQSAELVKSPTYWDADSILVGGVELINAQDTPSRASALRSGQIDYAAIIDPSQLPSLGDGFEVVSDVDPNALSTFMICKANAPLDDPAVRKAINMAIDREAINEVVLQGTATAATSLWPEGHRFNDPELADDLAYDPEGARAVLQDAGYADGVTVDMYYVDASNMSELAEVVQPMLAEVGIEATIVPGVNYVVDFLQANAEGMGLVPTMGANRRKLEQYTGDALGNTCGYSDPELEALKDDLSGVADDSEEAVEIWHQIEQIVVDDALSGFVAFRSRLSAYEPARVGGGAQEAYTIGIPDLRITYVKAGS